MLERNAQRARSIQVGMLTRAYRESFPSAGGGRGLTQEELLRRMAAVDGDYAQRYSHITVSRWESGATRPSRERLEVFGRALNLPESELAGLMLLAGFGDDTQSQRQPDSAEFDGAGADDDGAMPPSTGHPPIAATVAAGPVSGRTLRALFPSIPRPLSVAFSLGWLPLAAHSCWRPLNGTGGGCQLLTSQR